MRKLVVASMTFASGLALGTGSAGAARGMEVGVQDDQLFLHQGGDIGHYFSRDLAFRKVRRMQGSALRVSVIWAHAVADDQARVRRKPRRVRYDWAPYESLVRLARGYGVKVQFALTGPAPAWATPLGSVEKGYFRPRARLFGDFVRATARRFKGKVSRYSIWNEPNWSTWLGPQREAARRYRQLYRIGYAAIKRVDRRAAVWIGELAPYDTPHAVAPLKFLRRVACVNDRYRRTKRARRQRRAGLFSRKRCAGGTLKADGVAHHPYAFRVRPSRARRRGRDDVTIGTLGRMTAALDKLAAARALVPGRARRMPLYLTEFGYFRAGRRRIPEAKRAAWSVEAFEIAQRNRRVKLMTQYVLVRPPWGMYFDLSVLDAARARETRTYRAVARWARRAAARGRVKGPGRRRAGVHDRDPPPPPSSGPAPGTPPPEQPSCPFPVFDLFCPPVDWPIG